MNSQKFFFSQYPKITLAGVSLLLLLLLLLGLLLLESSIKPHTIKELQEIADDTTFTGLTYTGKGPRSEDSLINDSESFDSKSGVRTKGHKRQTIPHKKMGYAHPRNVKSIVTKSFENKNFINVTYNFDQHRRRVTPTTSPSTKTINSLFFGCSFTMGDSLNDNQTIPFYFGQLIPQVRSFNYALGGSGPPHMLYQIENRDFSIELPQAETNIGFYVYANGHVARTSIDLQHSTWLTDAPYYQLIDGKLQYFENFTHAKPIYSALYNFINKSHLMQKLAYPIASFFNHQKEVDSVKQTVSIILKAKEAFEKKVPNSFFYVLLFPGYNDSNPGLIAALNNQNVKSIELKLPKEGSFIIHEKETHLNEKANFLMAQGLVSKISKLIPQLTVKYE